MREAGQVKPACHVEGCSGTTSRFGRYCNRHKSRDRRHGHPLQETITAGDLASHIAAVVARLGGAAGGGRAWPALEGQWEAVGAWGRAVLGEAKRGRPMQRHRVQAAEEFLRVAAEAEPRTIIATALAVFVLEAYATRRFRTRRAFEFQLVRRVRALAEANVAVFRGKRVYRELPPRTAEAMAEVLVEAFAPAASRLVELERRDEERKRDQAISLRTALLELA